MVEELVDAIAGQCRVDRPFTIPGVSRIPQVHGGLMGHPSHHEARVTLARPRPVGLLRVSSSQHGDDRFEAVPEELGKISIGRSFRLLVPLPCRALFGDDGAPEVVHLGQVPHQVGDRPTGTAGHLAVHAGSNTGFGEVATVAGQVDEEVIRFHRRDGVTTAS